MFIGNNVVFSFNQPVLKLISLSTQVVFFHKMWSLDSTGSLALLCLVWL